MQYMQLLMRYLHQWLGLPHLSHQSIAKWFILFLQNYAVPRQHNSKLSSLPLLMHVMLQLISLHILRWCQLQTTIQLINAVYLHEWVL